MSSWVLKRSASDGGGYVARPGSPGSYTGRLQDARVYGSREAAERDSCPGNEYPVSVDEEMGGPR